MSTAAVPVRHNAAAPYHSLLYARALHPELFSLRDRRVVRREGAQVEAWLMPGAHLLRCDHSGACVSELVTDHNNGVPTADVVSAVLCVGDQDIEHAFEGACVRYFSSVQTESLSENLYLNTLQELSQHGEETGSMRHTWDDDAGPCMSMIELDSYDNEVHAHCYHLQARGWFVLRTLTMFATPA